ncbi:50S ribosomal protein L11 methyltransferase [Desulfobacterales bacterium HSG2]|nr:50S ribosomal protein L11 methyltransferase [Desulfobacterales bacterium HSG2]
MQWTEVKVIFDFDDKAFAADIISNIFYDLGVKGVVVESQTIEPADGWAGDDLEMPDEEAVIGYFPEHGGMEQKLDMLGKELKRLEKENGIISRIVCKAVDEEDWAESWKEHFWPEKVGKSVVVKPTWREYVASEGEVVLEIDPGMAFGTGAHPTTALCIRMIETYLKPGDSFLDIGTGSGILMIAAAKLGAETVWGVDTDEVAVKIAQKNLLLNRIGTERFRVMNSDLTDAVERRFDLVAANILSGVILVLLDTIEKVLAKGGVFICSGIIERNRDTVVRGMRDSGFEIMDIQTREEWVAIAGVRVKG